MLLLVFIIIILVLLLSGVLGSVFVFGGWIVVAVLCLVVLGMLITSIFSPLVNIRAKSREIKEINAAIKFKETLGYDTEDLRQRLEEVKKKYDSTYQKTKKHRRSLGYYDKQ